MTVTFSKVLYEIVNAYGGEYLRIWILLILGAEKSMVFVYFLWIKN